MKNKIVAIPAFSDNYIWALHSPDNHQIIVVDPGDSHPVLQYLKENKASLKAILLTHHHHDHSGGINALCQDFNGIPVYGPSKEKNPISGVNHPLAQGDNVSFKEWGLDFQVIDIPGHTLGHIAFASTDLLFCGDTLFSVGCGRVFEGSAQQMVSSLNKLKKLSPQILIFCGHEYTLNNIKFAKVVDPQNEYLESYHHQVLSQINNNQPSLPSRLETELKVNPFLRCTEKAIIQSVQAHSQCQESDEVSIFAALRKWKNEFVG